jgi:predicted DNA-binding transcriptional regulator YafY
VPSQDDATHLLHVWSITANEPRIFNLAHIEVLEDVEDAPPRQPVPKNPRATSSAFGIDSDHPGVAVIHMRGQVARWQATMTWHSEQRDAWLNEVFVREVPFHSRREFARFLAGLVDGIVAIGPPELAEAVRAHCALAHEIVTLPARSRESVADRG